MRLFIERRPSRWEAGVCRTTPDDAVTLVRSRFLWLLPLYVPGLTLRERWLMAQMCAFMRNAGDGEICVLERR